MKFSQLAANTKFVKGQTYFLLNHNFYIELRKIFVLEILLHQEYEIEDTYNYEFDEPYWTRGLALRVMEDGVEKIIAVENLDYDTPTFVFTSAKKALNAIKKSSSKVDHFDMINKSYFVTEYRSL